LLEFTTVTGQTTEIMRNVVLMGGIVGVLLVFVGEMSAAERESPGADRDFVQIGTMHQVIGQQDHGPRAAAAEICQRPDFYGVGALAGLTGELTFLKSKAFATRVTPGGGLSAVSESEANATLLIGQSVTQWKEVALREAIGSDDVDATLRKLIQKNKGETRGPLVFLIEGTFSDVVLHVINGACPVHARRSGVELAEEQKPYKLQPTRIEGTMVGVFALNAAGRMTHPGTVQHAHLVFRDPDSGERITGHVEHYGIGKSATLKLPADE
jgi:alpha-acetolactate decarboxylase